MGCYKPLIREEDLGKWITAKDGHRYHPAKVFSGDGWDDLERYSRLKYRGSKKYTLIPCGQCIGCRLDYSREWANRGSLEAKLYEQSWFVTLTYNDDHLPIEDYLEDREGYTWWNEGDWEGNLIPEDLKIFMHNLRQKIARKQKKDPEKWKNTGKIRFMACGEYGGQTARPHYHLIIFNMNLPLEDFYAPKIINKNLYYQSHLIEECWSREEPKKSNNMVSIGFSNISEATWNDISYTARYITKKINGEGSEQFYAAAGKIKEFFRVSRMPGIGEEYYRKHWEEIYKNDEIIVKNMSGVIKCKPPKYFDELLKKDQPDLYKEIKEKRQFLAEQSTKFKDTKSSLFRRQMLEIEERSKDEQNLKLVRMMETGSQ